MASVKRGEIIGYAVAFRAEPSDVPPTFTYVTLPSTRARADRGRFKNSTAVIVFRARRIPLKIAAAPVARRVIAL